MSISLYRLNNVNSLNRLTSASATGGSGGIYASEAYTYDASGNLSSKAGTAYAYGVQSDLCNAKSTVDKPHAVTSAGSAIFCYDANGNMTQKIAGSTTTSYTYDAENRMTAVSGAAAATFVYDGDGNRVKGVVGGVTTTYIGNYFEWSGSTSTMKKYYYAGGTRVAERVGTLSTSYYFLLTDHLGSTSITATRTGGFSSELRYKAWGETRYSSGSTPTTFRYTGQREESSLGLYWYASRWYSPGLGRFVSPDTIIPQPGSPQAWDRYGYVYSNPVRYTDPSGHKACDGQNLDPLACSSVSQSDLLSLLKFFYKWTISDIDEWSTNEIEKIIQVGQDLSNSFGSSGKVSQLLGSVSFSKARIKYGGLGEAHNVILSESGFSKWTVVHELAHAWDGVNGWKLSISMQKNLMAGFDHPVLHFLFPNNPEYWYDPGQGPPPCGVDAAFNRKEDFAESVTAYVYPLDAATNATQRGWPYQDAARGYFYSAYIDTPRGQYIKALIVSYQ